MKRVIAVSMLAMTMNCHAFNLISDIDASRFKTLSSNSIKPAQINKLMAFCDKSDSTIETCLEKIKAKSSDNQSMQTNMGNGLCCWNISGRYGDYMYYQGNDYCIPSCH